MESSKDVPSVSRNTSHLQRLCSIMTAQKWAVKVLKITIPVRLRHNSLSMLISIGYKALELVS